MRWIGTSNFGMLLLAIWLIIFGVSAFVPMMNMGVVLAVLAIVSGICILLGR